MKVQKMILLLLAISAVGMVQRDVTLILEEIEFDVNTSYEKFLKIENLDHNTGETDSLTSTVWYNVSNRSFRTNKTINKYSRTGLGVLNFSSARKTQFCGGVQPLNYNDTNLSNNHICVNITIGNLSEKNLTNSTSENLSNISANNTAEDSIDVCTCNLSIDLPRLLIAGETAALHINFCEEENRFRRNVTYWIEELSGEIVKPSLNTTYPGEKSFTPSVEEQEKSYRAIAKVSSCNITAAEIVTVYDPSYEPAKPSLNVSVRKVEGSTIFLDISGYKKDTQKDVLRVYLREDGERVTNMQKVYVREEGRFDFQTSHSFDANGSYDVVVRGLDFKESAKVTLEQVVKTKEVMEEPDIIQSFYTLKEKYADTITIFFTVTNADEVTVHSSQETKSVPPDKEQAAINISHPREILALQAKRDGVKQTKIINLNLEDMRNETTNQSKNEEKGAPDNTTNTSSTPVQTAATHPISINTSDQSHPSGDQSVFFPYLEETVFILSTVVVLYFRQIRQGVAVLLSKIT